MNKDNIILVLNILSIIVGLIIILTSARFADNIYHYDYRHYEHVSIVSGFINSRIVAGTIISVSGITCLLLEKYNKKH